MTTGAALLSGLETGVLGEAEWAARKPAADPSEAEEEALLAAEDFEAAALAFIAQRVTANSGVISLRNAFLMRLTERCVQDPPKEVKKEKTVAMNAEGKPVRVDNNWKAFLSKTGGKKTSVKRKEAPVKVQREEKKGTLLDGFEEVHSRKKIPLVKKK